MKYYCVCGHELKKTNMMGMGYNYYRCRKTDGGCDAVYGILGKRYWWNVPAIDEVTGALWDFSRLEDNSDRCCVVDCINTRLWGHWTCERHRDLELKHFDPVDDSGRLFYSHRGKEKRLLAITPQNNGELRRDDA